MIVLVAVLAGCLSAQEPKAPDKKKADAAKQNEKQPDLPFELQEFWWKDKGVGTKAWLTCLGQSYPATGPWGLLGARMMLSQPGIGLPDWEFVFEECLPIWHHYLELIQDDRRLPNVERKELKELSRPDWGMYLAMVQAVDRSHAATLDMFKKSAAANDHVGYRHLRGKPAQYRGQIITVKGQISRVDRWEAPRHVQTDIQYVYATEIFGPFKGEPPFTAVFTELPANVPYNKKIDMEVTFHGYFLAHVLFAGDPKKQERDVISPYLVGKTLIVNRTTPVADNTESYSYTLIVGVVGGIVCVVVLGVLLNFWFRRGDRRIETRLAQVRDKHLPFNLEPAEPEAPPLADPVPPPSTPPPGENGAI
jgi:hypothetical protein